MQDPLFSKNDHVSVTSAVIPCQEFEYRRHLAERRLKGASKVLKGRLEPLIVDVECPTRENLGRSAEGCSFRNCRQLKTKFSFTDS